MRYLFILLFVYCTMVQAKEERSGTVREILNSGPYTYLKVAEANTTRWVAVTRLPVKEGATVIYHPSMEIEKFESKSLKRTFHNLIFADAIRFADTAHSRTIPSLAEQVKKSKISPYKKEGMLSVAELFAHAERYKGKKVQIRGKVVKVAREIMKRDWVHIEDGTGNAGTDDLVCTTPKADVQKGDVVTCEGTVAIEKDFGYGYFYPVIIEKSRFVKE